jgi:hypothetical protein
MDFRRLTASLRTQLQGTRSVVAGDPVFGRAVRPFRRFVRGTAIRVATAMSILLAADRAVAQTGTVASADECARFRGNAFCSSPGVIWCGTATVLKSSDLARYAAPILWFSPDEPLLPPPATEPGERAEEWTRRVPLPQTLRIVDGEHDGPSVNGGVG